MIYYTQLFIDQFPLLDQKLLEGVAMSYSSLYPTA